MLCCPHLAGIRLGEERWAPKTVEILHRGWSVEAKLLAHLLHSLLSRPGALGLCLVDTNGGDITRNQATLL